MVYVATDWSGAVKIGVTHDMYRRMSVLQTGNPRKIDVLIIFETESIRQDRKLEKIFHTEFRKGRIVFDNGRESEWFEDSTLDFLLKRTEDFINYIKEKYGFKIVKFASDICYQQIEERHLDNLKAKMSANDLYNKKILPENKILKSKNKPMFKINDIVQVRNMRTSHFWVGGLSTPIKLPVKLSKIVSVNKDDKTDDFYYVLESGFSYRENDLDLFENY